MGSLGKRIENGRLVQSGGGVKMVDRNGGGVTEVGFEAILFNFSQVIEVSDKSDAYRKIRELEVFNVECQPNGNERTSTFKLLAAWRGDLKCQGLH
jgi:hypothetical protein